MSTFSYKNTLYFTIFIVLPCLILHSFDISLLPHGEHNWAQSDHYAIALGFLENHFDFFHAKTFTLNHQFPPDIPLVKREGITAVDFPILHYVVAILMKLFNYDAPIIFRLVTLFYSLIALYFLFNTLVKTKNLQVALWLCAFILLQPIFFYYQDGFHVSTAAFSSFLLGASHFILYEKYKFNKNLFWAFFFITLASLMRFTHVIILIAFLGTFILGLLTKKKTKTYLLYTITSLGIIFLYFFHNKYLQKTYGSVFLNKPLPPDSFSEFFENFSIIIISYAKRFLPLFHFIIFTLLLYVYLNNSKKITTYIQWQLFLILQGIGVFSYTILMSWSLSVHYYYSLETWFPFLIGIILFLVFRIKQDVFNRAISYYLYIPFFILAFSYVSIIQYKNYSKLNDGDLVIKGFKESKNLVDKTIPKNETLMIVCNNGYNTPLIMLKRNSYRINGNLDTKEPEVIDKSKYHFLIIYKPDFITSSSKSKENLKKYFELIAQNNYIYIWKKTNLNN